MHIHNNYTYAYWCTCVFTAMPTQDMCIWLPHKYTELVQANGHKYTDRLCGY